MEEILTFINQYPKVVMGLNVIGSLVIIMTVIAPLTPTKKDDEILDKVEKSSILKAVVDFLKRFSLINKK